MLIFHCQLQNIIYTILLRDSKSLTSTASKKAANSASQAPPFLPFVDKAKVVSLILVFHGMILSLILNGNFCHAQELHDLLLLWRLREEDCRPIFYCFYWHPTSMTKGEIEGHVRAHPLTSASDEKLIISTKFDLTYDHTPTASSPIFSDKASKKPISSVSPSTGQTSSHLSQESLPSPARNSNQSINNKAKLPARLQLLARSGSVPDNITDAIADPPGPLSPGVSGPPSSPGPAGKGGKGLLHGALKRVVSLPISKSSSSSSSGATTPVDTPRKQLTPRTTPGPMSPRADIPLLVRAVQASQQTSEDIPFWARGIKDLEERVATPCKTGGKNLLVRTASAGPIINTWSSEPNSPVLILANTPGQTEAARTEGALTSQSSHYYFFSSPVRPEPVTGGVTAEVVLSAQELAAADLVDGDIITHVGHARVTDAAGAKLALACRPGAHMTVRHPLENGEDGNECVHILELSATPASGTSNSPKARRRCCRHEPLQGRITRSQSVATALPAFPASSRRFISNSKRNRDGASSPVNLAPTMDNDTMEARLKNFYKTHVPDCVPSDSTLAKICQAYEGEEGDLWKDMHKEFGDKVMPYQLSHSQGLDR
eukprot:g65851.t1